MTVGTISVRERVEKGEREREAGAWYVERYTPSLFTKTCTRADTPMHEKKAFVIKSLYKY